MEVLVLQSVDSGSFKRLLLDVVSDVLLNFMAVQRTNCVNCVCILCVYLF